MKCFLILACVGLCTAGYGRSAETKQLWAKSFIDQPAPKIQVGKWLTAQPNTKGKFVLIDFWATWCPPCRAAISELDEIQQKLGDQVAVIGLSDEDEDTVRGFQAYANAKKPEWVINYAIAIDTQKKMKNAVEVTGIPHLMLIDPSGVVRWEGFPFLEGHEFSIQVVEAILRTRKVAD